MACLQLAYPSKIRFCLGCNLKRKRCDEAQGFALDTRSHPAAGFISGEEMGAGSVPLRYMPQSGINTNSHDIPIQRRNPTTDTAGNQGHTGAGDVDSASSGRVGTPSRPQTLG